MPARDIVHMYEIESSVDECRNTAVGGFDDDPSRRRRPHITWTDWRRWINDDGAETSFRHHGLDQSFGDDLAALVGANGLILMQADVSSAAIPLDCRAMVATLLV